MTVQQPGHTAARLFKRPGDHFPKDDWKNILINSPISSKTSLLQVSKQNGLTADNDEG
jgi:hypothetical protein